MTDKQRRAMFAKQGGRGLVAHGRRKDMRPGRTRVSPGAARRGVRSRAQALTQPGSSPQGFEAFLKKHEGLIGREVQARIRRSGLPRGGELEKELRQEGAIALWRAKQNYDPKKGKWSTFATRHIKGAVGRALKKQGPVTLGEREVRRRLRRGETLPGLADLTDVDKEQMSLGGIPQSEARLTIHSLLKGYSTRDRSIVIGALGEGRSQNELAKKYKLSRARVNQIIAGIRKEVRQKERAA